MSQAPAPYLLVVDDSDEDLFLFKRLVHRAGITLLCQSAPGVAAATALLEAALLPESPIGRPVACFVDIKMPAQNGFDLLQWIRRHAEFATLPVIMFSSSDDPRDLEQAASLGAQGYLTKFPSTNTLVEVIRDAKTYPTYKDAFNKPYNRIPRTPLPVNR